MNIHKTLVGILPLILAGVNARAEVKVTTERNREGTAQFAFKTIGAPLKNDLAANGKFAIVDGANDPNGGGLQTLTDGRLPDEDDQPARNFFFNAGSDGGRIQLDLGGVMDVKEVNSYSWHASDRAAQVYKLFAADGTATGFNATPKRDLTPEQCGWKLIAAVDTRPSSGERGGQYGVSIGDASGALGKYRYLLFDISRTQDGDPFGNTFYSEIDVRAVTPAEPEVAAAARSTGADGSDDRPFLISLPDKSCQISVNTSEAPDLKEWAEKKLAPVLADWYPKLVAMLPSEGYSAPTNFSVNIKPGQGVAATGGTRITANSKWLERELDREALGALLHEEVHVIQQYRGGRRSNSEYQRPPGWLVEGIPDYIRWFRYEPQSHGADAAYFRTRRNLKLSYDGLYRISANFLNYVIEKYGKDKDVLAIVNSACRRGKYTDDLWKELTGKPLPELNEEWKTAVLRQLIERP